MESDPSSSATNVKALTAMFADRKISIIRMKNPLEKAEDGPTSPKPKPKGPKPPIISQKPVLPKPAPRKPLRSKRSPPKKETEQNSATIEVGVDPTRTQSSDSLSTISTIDSGLGSALALENVDKNLQVKNEFYSLNSPAEDEKVTDSIDGRDSKCSSRSNNSEGYPKYRRVLLSDLKFPISPPQKPRIPPDVHIAMFRGNESSPPPAPPRRLSKSVESLESPPKLMPRSSFSKSPSRPLVPIRPSPPPPVSVKQHTPTFNGHITNLNKVEDDENENFIIPEYGEEEEMADEASWDVPPPLPEKPSPHSPLFKQINKNEPNHSYYQTPNFQTQMAESDSQGDDALYCVPREAIPIPNCTISRKEQKDREKRERKLARMKKKYSLTGSERAISFGRISETIKGKRNDLSVKKDEHVDILRMVNNSPGTWLVRNLHGKMGYVDKSNVQIIDSVEDNLISNQNGDNEDNYYDAINYTEEAIYEETC